MSTSIKVSSPYMHSQQSTAQVMRWVMLAILPAAVTQCWLFGWSVLIQLILACLFACLLETLCLALRKRPVWISLQDGSALVTALLLALAIPPLSPWWIIAIGMLAAIVLAKHIYGGLGHNPFNPAMVAYAILLISFPVQMTQWALPNLQDIPSHASGWLTPLTLVFTGTHTTLIDTLTGATPLDILKHRNGLTIQEVWQQSSQLSASMHAQYLIAIAWLTGGLLLLYRRIITWHAPIGMLASLWILSALFYAGNPSHFASPLVHISAGASIMCAFFIITDPVSCATSHRGKLVFGIGVGSCIFIIRNWGSYPDAVAFAVLLMNLCAPFIDYYTQPRTYGHPTAKRGPNK